MPDSRLRRDLAIRGEVAPAEEVVVVMHVSRREVVGAVVQMLVERSPVTPVVMSSVCGWESRGGDNGRPERRSEELPLPFPPAAELPGELSAPLQWPGLTRDLGPVEEEE